jgi:hypothetical protein
MSSNDTSSHDILLNNINVFTELLRSDVSNRITLFVKRVCEDLHLDPDVRVLISLRDFTEDEKLDNTSLKICGFYEPDKKLIIISLPCVNKEKNQFFRTLAHEIVHHCQHTCNNKLCRDLVCKISIHDKDFVKEINTLLPYELRPHEIEAFKMQDEIAKKIISIKGSNEVEILIEDLNQMLKTQTLTFNISSLNVIDILLREEAIKDLIVKRWEEITNDAKRSLEEQNVDECVRGFMTKRLSSDLFSNLNEFLEEQKKSFLENTLIKKIIMIPIDSQNIDVYIITDRGFALHKRVKERAPLTGIILDPTSKIYLHEIIKSSDVKILYDILRNDGKLTLKQNKNKDLILFLRKDLDETIIIDELHKICTEAKNKGNISYDIIKLLNLITFLSKINKLDDLQIINDETHESMVKVRVKGSDDETLLICGDLEVESLHEKFPVKEILEKLMNWKRDLLFFNIYVLKVLLEMLIGYLHDDSSKMCEKIKETVEALEQLGKELEQFEKEIRDKMSSEKFEIMLRTGSS